MKLIDIDELMRKNQSENMREKLRKYLETEEVLMKKCHSAFVVKLYDSFENQRCKVLVMEYCRHGGLDNFIVQRGAIEEEDAVSILRQIILGLAVCLPLLRNFIRTTSSTVISSQPTYCFTMASLRLAISASARRYRTARPSLREQSPAQGPQWRLKSVPLEYMA